MTKQITFFWPPLLTIYTLPLGAYGTENKYRLYFWQLLMLSLPSTALELANEEKHAFKINLFW